MLALCFCMVPPLSVGRAEESGKNAIMQEMLKSNKALKERLDRMEKDLHRLAHPVWEYKLVFPNMLHSESRDDGIYDGVDFTKLGKAGWELINYSDDYGFIFKRRRAVD